MDHPKKVADVIVEEIGQGLGIYNKERDESFVLNGTSSIIWKQCDGYTSVQDLANLLAQELNLPPTQADQLTTASLRELADARLLVWTEPASPTISRRQLIGMIATAGLSLALLPIVSSEPIQALESSLRAPSVQMGTSTESTSTSTSTESTSTSTSTSTEFTTTALLGVTVSYFLAKGDGNLIDIQWQTATEIGNAGFNLYAESDGHLHKLNASLIPSKVIDSVETIDYTYSTPVNANTFFIEEVGIDGKTERTGPFRLGVVFGVHSPSGGYLPPKNYLPFIR